MSRKKLSRRQFVAATAMSSAALITAPYIRSANAAGKLREVRNAVAQARANGDGIFASSTPLRIHAFELRFLAQRRAPDRWVIDLGANDATLLKPQNYHLVAQVEDRLFIPEDYVTLFEQAGWQRQP